eukprot:4515250-Amphidinium_carterae.1
MPGGKPAERLHCREQTTMREVWRNMTCNPSIQKNQLVGRTMLDPKLFHVPTLLSITTFRMLQLAMH